MALLNNNKKFVFFHLYKCGGMSVRTLLRNSIEGNTEILKSHCIPRDLQHHYSIRGKKSQFNDLFKFTFVRNPFSFLLSLYYHARANKRHFWHKQALAMPFKDFPNFYISKINYTNELIANGEDKIITPYEFVRNNNDEVIIDFIGKFESIDRDMNVVLKKINHKPLKLPSVNVNKLNNKPYRKVYTKDSRKFVEKYFAKDLDFFKYEF